MQMLNNQAHTGIFINADGGAKTLCNRHIDTNQRYIKTSKILDFHHVYTERRDDHGINVVPQWNLLKQLPTIGYIGNVIRTNVIALRLQHIIQRPTNVRVKPSGHRLANQHGNTERLLCFQRRSGTRDSESKLLCRSHNLFTRFLQHLVRMSECSRNSGRRHAGFIRDILRRGLQIDTSFLLFFKG